MDLVPGAGSATVVSRAPAWVRLRQPMLVGLGGLAGLGLVGLADALDQRLFPPCPLHGLTGLWCPLCGGTRTVGALLQGDVAAAAGYNVLVLAFAPVVVLGLLWWAFGAATGRNDGRIPVISTRLVAAVAVTFVVFAVVRNLPGMELLNP